MVRHSVSFGKMAIAHSKKQRTSWRHFFGKDIRRLSRGASSRHCFRHPHQRGSEYNCACDTSSSCIEITAKYRTATARNPDDIKWRELNFSTAVYLTKMKHFYRTAMFQSARALDEITRAVGIQPASYVASSALICHYGFSSDKSFPRTHVVNERVTQTFPTEMFGGYRKRRRPVSGVT